MRRGTHRKQVGREGSTEKGGGREKRGGTGSLEMGEKKEEKEGGEHSAAMARTLLALL